MKILAICTVLLLRECLFFFPSSASSLGLIEILALFLFGIYPVLHPQRGSNSGFWSRPSRSLMLWSEGIFRCVCIIKVISNDSLIKKWLSPCIYTFPSLKSLNFNTLMVLHGLFTTIQHFSAIGPITICKIVNPSQILSSMPRFINNTNNSLSQITATPVSFPSNMHPPYLNALRS